MREIQMLELLLRSWPWYPFWRFSRILYQGGFAATRPVALLSICRLHVLYLKDVTKVSSCWAITTSRQGKKHLQWKGFLLFLFFFYFPMKGARGLIHTCSSWGKSLAPTSWRQPWRQIALAPAWKPYQVRLLFTHTNMQFGTIISVTEWNYMYTTLISKELRHIIIA